MEEDPPENELINFDSQQVIIKETRQEPRAVPQDEDVSDEEEVYIYRDGFYKKANKEEAIEKRLYDEAQLRILALEEEIASYKTQIMTFRKRHEAMLTEHEIELKSVLDNQELIKSNVSMLKKIAQDEEILRLKPKKKNQDGQDILSCEYKGCTEKQVDLIKCNVCNSWVCEKCSDLSINKLKPIFNKCKTLHFLCKSCESHIDSTLDDSNDHLNKQETITTIRNLISDGISQIEAKIESTISEKIKERIADLHSSSTTTSSDGAGNDLPSYAKKVLEVPKEIRKIIRNERNEEKVELMEKERRSSNFIIHGAEEFGATSEEIKEADTLFVNDILKHLRIKSKPVSVTRLGKIEKGKYRTLKIVMSNSENKEMVMANLNKLKGTGDTFGWISVTDDYTNMEREQIRNKVTEAKELSKKNPNRIFKVRGEPKNGLRIVSYTKA